MTEKLGRHRRGVVPMSFYGSSVKTISAQYSGKCRICDKWYSIGDRVTFDKYLSPGRKIAHAGCARNENL